MGRLKKIKQARNKETTNEGIQPLQLLSRNDYLLSLLLSTLTFIVYAFTAAPGVTFADSGDFLSGVLTLGIVHPPGYPLYTVLGHLFSYLPFGDPAFRVNLFSVLWGSLSLAMMFLILRMLSIERIYAAFTTLFLGFTTVFWSKTGVAEVYSFNAFLIASIFFSILIYNRDKKKTQLYLIFLTTGFALSNHYPLVILTGVGLVFLLDRRDLYPADLVKGILFLALGLTPYLYLFIQALNPQIEYNFGKNSDFRMVLHHISRKYYINEYGGTLWDKLPLVLTLSKAIITNYLFSSLILVFGIAYTLLEKWTFRYPLLIAALSPSLGLILILTFPTQAHFRALLLDYSIPTFLFFAVFLAVGLRTLMYRYVKSPVLQVFLLITLLLTQVGFNFPSSTHRNDKLAEIWATDLLNSLKPTSILILCGAGQLQLPLYYLRFTKGLRPDVTLYDRFSLFTKDNLYAPELLFQRVDRREYRNTREQQLISNSSRPIYYNCKDVLEQQNIDFSVTPFVFRVDKNHFEASDLASFRSSDRLLISLVNGYPKSDYWLDRSRKGIFSRLISYYGAHNPTEVNRILDYFMKTKYYSNPQFMLELANNLYYFKNYDLAREFYQRGEDLSLEAFTPTDLAVFCHVLANERNYEKALRICIHQEQSSPLCDVNAVKTQERIASIYKEQGNWQKVGEYSRKVLQCQPNHKIGQRYLELATQRTN